MKTAVRIVIAIFLLMVTAGLSSPRGADQPELRTGQAALGGWRTDAPGVRRKITVEDLPPPYATSSAVDVADIVARPPHARLKVPPGFVVQEFASGLKDPRLIRVAPNGDIFIAESRAGRICVLRAADGASHPSRNEVYAAGLKLPFGINFWPPGPNPRYVYIANTDSVVRFPYRNGDLKARGPAQVIVRNIPGGGHLRGGGHWTRDILFSKDGSRMFVSVGSLTNDADDMPRRPLKDAIEYDKRHGLGAAWGDETRRADVLEFKPDGSSERIFATGLRNCVGMALNAVTGDLWCSTNERDGLGNNLPPDYITRVHQGAFYGWPWYYIGGHPDPHHKDERPDLKDKVTVPDVLLEAHSASLEMAFYDAQQFPAEYRGDAFAAEHGSWNRAPRTGYKVIRAIVHDGKPTGEYDDFMTGFVTDNGEVWGRPVGVAVAHDGSLLVTEDAHGTVWRITYKGASSATK
jgi:glucose/arabinose dehydrogenase